MNPDMTLGVTFDLTGDRELEQQLAALDRGTRAPEIEKGLRAGGRVVIDGARHRVRVESGNLSNGICMSGGEGLIQPTTGTDIGGAEFTDQRGYVLVGTNVAYGRREELGFTGRDARGRFYHQPAHPYLRPAIDEQLDEIQHAIAESFEESVRDAVGRRT